MRIHSIECGLKALPWGTPAVGEKGRDINLSCFTLTVLSLRKLVKSFFQRHREVKSVIYFPYEA